MYILLQVTISDKRVPSNAFTPFNQSSLVDLQPLDGPVALPLRERDRSAMAHRGQPSGGVPEDLDDTWSNQFWSGPEAPGVDGGVDVVLGRLKGGTRTLEDLRAFYKERASIEEDYAKRLTRLSRQTLGKDEGGSMRMSLDRVRQETAKAADAHDKLAHMMRTSLEAKSKEFELARDAKRRNVRSSSASSGRCFDLLALERADGFTVEVIC